MSLSFIIYISLYQWYLPISQHVKPLHFQYDSNCDQDVYEGLCSFPKVSTLLHDSFGKANDGSRVLTRGQNYDIYLELELGAQNEKHMFMTQIDMITKDNSVIISRSRSVMLSSPSSFVSTLLTLVKVIPTLFGIVEENEYLVVTLLKNYIDDSYNPAVRVNISINSKYLNFHSAKLRIVALFTGVRYYMHNWPLIFNIFGFSIVLFIVSAISLERVSHRSANVQSRRARGIDNRSINVSRDLDNVTRPASSEESEDYEEIYDGREEATRSHTVYNDVGQDEEWASWLLY